MATCNTSTLLESAKCFSCLSKKELQAVVAQLLCNIATDGVPVDPDESVLVNVKIDFTLVSGTTDDVTYTLPDLPIGWKTVSWNWFVNSTPAGAWGGDAAAIGMWFYYDIEDNAGLTDSIETHTGSLIPNIPPDTSMAGMSNAHPFYFKHAHNAPNNASFYIAWDTQPAVGETVGGYVRLLITRESSS